jgi:hypothetical protein
LVQEGNYVTIEIEDVPADLVRARDPNMPLLLWSLLEHENKMSVVHFTLKMQPEWQEPIKYVCCIGTKRGRPSGDALSSVFKTSHQNVPPP